LLLITQFQLDECWRFHPGWRTITETTQDKTAKVCPGDKGLAVGPPAVFSRMTNPKVSGARPAETFIGDAG
jgi:hypothetical protein